MANHTALTYRRDRCNLNVSTLNSNSSSRWNRLSKTQTQPLPSKTDNPPDFEKSKFFRGYYPPK